MSNSARPDAHDQPLLARILGTSHLAQVVPRLPPEVLHRVIERCGLEDSGGLVALATPDQLRGVLDLDLWRSDRPGRDEQFDAERFGVWLEVLVESGADVAARTLASLDVSLVTVALASHMLVFDPAAVSSSGEVDGEEVPVDRKPDTGLTCDIGGYRVAARRNDTWDAIVAVLVSLDADHGDAFHRIMRGCRRLSHSRPEVDGLDNLLTDPEQVAFDLSSDRERRREYQGYATPAEARAFLESARRLDIGRGTTPTQSPVAAAYFRAIDENRAADAQAAADRSASGSPPAYDDSAAALASLFDVLVDEGVVPRPPRALLDAAPGSVPRLALIQAHLQSVHDSDAAEFMIRNQELAFLANTIVAGCSIQARPFTAVEASDATLAVCNLGLENWPPQWQTPGGDLVRVFQVGWSVLHQHVCVRAAERLVSVLARLKCDDRETQAGLRALRAELVKHLKAGAPWRARDAMDVLASLDMPAWTTLLGLIDECPVIHSAIGASQGSGMRAVSASDFEFISENGQVASVRAFMQALPLTLQG